VTSVVVRLSLDFYGKMVFCIMCCVHFRSELFFGFICAQGGFSSAVFPVSQIDTFALQIFVL
jgi:hypothetical protein